MLEQVAHYNDLSPALRKKLNERIASYGKKMKYKFAISSLNPDPEKYNGPTIWPSRYTLDPVVFDIIDAEEKRDGKSRAKKIGIITGVDEKGIPNKFGRIRILGKDEGVKELDLETPEGIAEAMCLELHPKFSGGLFQDTKKTPIVFRVDEKKEAQIDRDTRNAKLKASIAASKMSNEQIRQFAAAMTWDETDEMEVLRNKVEKMAEESPKIFNDLVESEAINYQSVIKRAITKGVIAYDPVGFKFLWSDTQIVITVLGAGDLNKNEVERFAEFLRTGGPKAGEIFDKIEGLLKS